MGLITKETFKWGVKLTAQPLPNLQLAVEITQKSRRAAAATVTWSPALLGDKLNLQDAQAWHNALGALLTEAWSTIASMKESEV